MFSRWLRNSFIYLLVLVAVIAVVFAFFSGGDSKEKVTFGQVIEDSKAGLVEKVQVANRKVTATYYEKDDKNKQKVLEAKIGSRTDVENLLVQGDVPLTSQGEGKPGVDLEYKSSGGFGPWLGLLLNLLPFLLFGLFLLLIMRQAQGSNSQAMSFGKSRARLFTGSKVTVTFADVAGVDEAKEELAEVVVWPQLGQQ